MTLQTRTTADSDRSDVKLSGNIGVVPLILTILAFAAPIAMATGYIPLGYAYAGLSAPMVIVITFVLVAIFVVGFVAMTRHVKLPGAFYSYISNGLGKTPGLVAAFLAAGGYFMLTMGSFAFSGVIVSDTIRAFGGPETSWMLWAAVTWLLVLVLGYFKVDLSIRILAVVIALEVGMILVFGLGAAVFGAGEGTIDAQPFDASHLTSANIPVAMVFAILMFIGFEAAAVFRDEVKDPERTIPRATFGAVVVITLLHLTTSYSLYMVYGADTQALALESPTTMFPDGIGAVVAPVMTQVTSIVVMTSQLAATIATHNVAVRYVHRLASDRALPHYFAALNPRFGSPFRASNLVGVLAAVILGLMVVTGADSPVLYGQLMGVGLIGLILLMSVVSLAVIVYFARRGMTRSVGVIQTVVCPAIAFVGFGALAINQFFTFAEVFGGEQAQVGGLFLVLLAMIVGGLAVALYLRTRKPQIYANLCETALED